MKVDLVGYSFIYLNFRVVTRMINTKKIKSSNNNCYRKRNKILHRKYISNCNDGSKKTKKKVNNIEMQKGGEVTTLRNIDQERLDKMKISNYVNANIDWGIMPGPPPTDCVIM